MEEVHSEVVVVEDVVAETLVVPIVNINRLARDQQRPHNITFVDFLPKEHVQIHSAGCRIQI